MIYQTYEPAIGVGLAFAVQQLQARPGRLRLPWSSLLVGPQAAWRRVAAPQTPLRGLLAQEGAACRQRP